MLKKWMSAMACVLALFALPAHAAPALRPFEADSMARIVAAHKGKPFVLVVWSLDCEYCLNSLDALAREKAKGKLDVVTLSTDPIEDPQAAALMRKKLEAVGMQNNAWAFGEAPPEQLRYAIDPKWHGEMPRSYWFDGHGERTAHSGLITPQMIARFAG